MALRWTDDHCHLPSDPSKAADLVEDAHAAGVERLITVGTDLDSSRAAIGIARFHAGTVFATAGLHPHDAKDGLDGIEALLGEPEVVAVGECGLDYHYDHSPRDVQREVFAAQVALAVELARPVVIHTRVATDDTMAVLREAGAGRVRGVMHCFSGTPDEARQALDLGFYISLAGIVTFPKADDLREVARLVPLDRLLVETDAPFLAPVPYRGRRNEPAWARVTLEAIARLRGVPFEELSSHVGANVRALMSPPVGAP
jgi:TatD DNase family protein